MRLLASGQIKVETKPWKVSLPSRDIEIELTTVQSNYHVEMNPSDVGNQDRHIVQEVIKVRASPSLLAGSMQHGCWLPHTTSGGFRRAHRVKLHGRSAHL